MSDIIEGSVREKIFSIRSQQVMLDSDIAELYGVETKRINEAVKNNPDKFPVDFMFELTTEEWSFLRSKTSTLNELDGRGKHRKYLPKAFTEQGVYMLATVLKSKKATEVTISIMRTFTHLRHFGLQHGGQIAELFKMIREVDRKHDNRYKEIVAYINQLINESDAEAVKRVGFIKEE